MWRAGTAKQRAIRRTARLPLIGVAVALRFAFLVPLLTSAGGCSVLGYLGGRGIDARMPDLDTLSVGGVRTRPAQTPVAVFLQDGGIVRGRLQGVHELDPLEAHRALAARLPDDVRLPSKGDIVRITVYGASGSAIFERVARPGERYEELGKASMARATTPVALFASGSRSGLLGSPLASIDRLQWRDGIEMRGPDLSDAVVAAGLPDPQVLVLTDSTGAADSIPAWNVRGVEAPRLKPWAGRGALIGSSLDFTMAYLYIRAREALGRALQ